MMDAHLSVTATQREDDMKKKDMTEQERIVAEMTVLERQICDRAGEWEIKNGRWWWPALHTYVVKCAACKHLFLADRCDKKTCGDTCRKRRSNANAKKNLRHGSSQLSF